MFRLLRNKIFFFLKVKPPTHPSPRPLPLYLGLYLPSWLNLQQLTEPSCDAQSFDGPFDLKLDKTSLFRVATSLTKIT